MPWQRRLREAAYTSPSGTRFVFSYENVTRSFDKQTTAFDFPDVEGTLIQDFGRSGRRHPIRAIFWGDDCDLEADAFEDALAEPGVGKLEHPLYGRTDVVPFGAVNRRDDLKTAANQAIVQVVLWETILATFPTSQKDAASQVIASVNEYNDALAEQFAKNVDVSSTFEQISLKNSYEVLLDQAREALQPLADTQENVQKQFDAIVDSINSGIDVLIADPLTLAFQTAIMLQAPARALTAIGARLDAYGDLANSISGTSRPLNPAGEPGDTVIADGNIATTGTSSVAANEYFTKDMFASTAITGSILSVVNTVFETKTEALLAAEEVLLKFEDIVVWRDANYASLNATSGNELGGDPQGTIDTGEAYQKLQEAVAFTAGFLVEISFTLKQERRIVLDRARTAIDLEAELYGTAGANLDFLIASNDLTGSEILELPRGREIVYYI